MQAAVNELAQRFSNAAKCVDADRITRSVLTDALRNLIDNIKSDAPSVTRVLNKKKSQSGGTTPYPLAFFNGTEEASFLTGAAGSSDTDSEFPTTMSLTESRFEIPSSMSGGGGGKKLSLPRDILKAIQGVAGARETLSDALELLLCEVKQAGSISKGVINKSALKKVLTTSRGR